MITRILFFLMSTFVGAVALACMMVLIPHTLWLEPGQTSTSFMAALRSAIAVVVTFGFPIWLLISLTTDKRGAMSRKGGLVFGAMTGLAAWSFQYSADTTLWWLAAFLTATGALAGMFYAGLEVSRFEVNDAERRARWVSAPQGS